MEYQYPYEGWRGFQEGFITVVHGKVVTDKASQVDFVNPASFPEAAPAFIGVLICHKSKLLTKLLISTCFSLPYLL